MMQKPMSLDDAAIVIVKVHNCIWINLWFMAKSKAVGRMKNAGITENSVEL